MKKTIISALCTFSVLITGFIGGCSFDNIEQNVEPTQIGSTVVSPENTNAMRLNVSPLSGNEISPMSNPFPLPGFYQDFQITATVSSFSTLRDLTWNVEFVNADSEWATGKTVTEYVEVKQDTEYDNIAYARVYQAFAEQIRIVVASAYNPAIFASVTCDYKARLSGGNLSFPYVDGGYSSASALNVPMSDFSTENPTVTLTEAHTGTRLLDYSILFGDGTTFPTKEDCYVSLTVFCSALYEALSGGHALLPVRSSFSEMSSGSTDSFSIRYEHGDEINLDLPGIDLLTDATKTLIIQSRDYMLGYTDKLPDDWDNGETYSAYCALMNSTGEDLSARIYLKPENCQMVGTYNNTKIVYEYGWFKCPMTSVVVDETTLVF